MNIYLVCAGGQWYVGTNFTEVASGQHVLHDAWLVLQQIGMTQQGLKSSPPMLFPLQGYPAAVKELTFDYVNCYYAPENQSEWQRMLEEVELQAAAQRSGIALVDPAKGPVTLP